MAILNWGNEKLEVGRLGALGFPISWITFPEIAQGTSQLTTEEGNVTEALDEGGNIIDTRTEASKYTFECTVFVKKGDKKPIEDFNGVITDNYALRLIPEDPSGYCWIMDKCSVSCVETWSSADGSRWTYKFKGLKPPAGRILKPFYNIATPNSLEFASAADTTGKTVTVDATGTVTAVSDQTWATVTVTAKTVTVKVTANGTGETRAARVTVSADGKTVDVVVAQAG
jgi:hypothetical protein